MDSAVNFDNLRVITGGDKSLESELFRMFLDSSQKCLTALRSAANSDNDIWKKEAHALKGLSLNLGAAALSAICKKAQDGYTAPAEDKMKMLAEMEQEFARVKQVLEEESRAA